MVRILRVFSLVFLSATLFAAIMAPSAGAWGTRYAYRDCGSNLIGSETRANGNPYKAMTMHYSGSCSDSLGTALRISSSSYTSFNWAMGSSYREAYTGTFIGGGHKGCMSCGTSTT